MLEYNSDRLPPEVQLNLDTRIPSHLKDYLLSVNPYTPEAEIWSSLPCFGAVLSFFMQSLEAYVTIEDRLIERTKDQSGSKILPTILHDCFQKASGRQFGDLAVFYKKDWHIHAGLWVGSQDKHSLILSKKNLGLLPLLVDTDSDLTEYFGANRLDYFRLRPRIYSLESVYLNRR